MLGFLILLLLMMALLLIVPWWPYSRHWGYYPGAFVLLLLLAFLIAVWFGWVLLVWPWSPA
ncbi:MAG TPA: DUF3309 family protein [Burkholderiaceae bacterium]|jgi:ABC-type polysaccharide/polyol phosphate export permease|nr:DUF3309 family protein [Burkholderiaceae bacterium]